MFIKQIYTNCLAHAAYYIESEKEAAVVDPLRDPEPYIKLAEERGARIKYVLETHFHADFVSGHIDLANKTGASIVFGPNADAAYQVYSGADGERLRLGNSHIEIVHTPGHTIESTCFLLLDNDDNKHAIFTGDTLFVGDVGRPDLLSGNLTKEALAAMMYDSLKHKIKTLPDGVLVYPGHGAGSACGKNIGTQSFTTIGEQKSTNYALITDDKDAFIKAVTNELPVAPAYFFKDASINKTGYQPFESVMNKNLKPLSLSDFSAARSAGCLILDTRSSLAFAAGHIDGALNIGLNGDFAVWVGTLIDVDTPLLIITEPGKEREAIERLARIGYEHVTGYLENGMPSWIAAHHPVEQLSTISGSDCAGFLASGEYELLAVRNRLETARHRLIGSGHIPLNILKSKMDTLDKDKKWLIYCAGGYRSMIAASLLKAHGFKWVASIDGGIKEVIHQAPQLVEMDME